MAQPTYPDERLKRIIYPRPHRQHERTPGRQFTKCKQLLLAPDLAMIPLRSLLHLLLVLCHLLGVGEGDTVDPLEGILGGQAFEVGRGVLSVS